MSRGIPSCINHALEWCIDGARADMCNERGIRAAAAAEEGRRPRLILIQP